MKKLLALLILAGLPLTASGQSAPTDFSAGITVVGTGISSAAVKMVFARVAARDISDSGQFFAAMTAAGIEQGVVVGMDGTGIDVGGRIGAVTRAKLDAVTKAAGDFAAAHPPAAILGVHFFASADDCTAIEQHAREAALADALGRATAIATANGKRLGDRIALIEDGGCPRPGPLGGTRAIDIETLALTIGVKETITFAIAK
jgi:uncharacterized protein YggE